MMIKIGSINVHGIGSNQKQICLLHDLRSLDIDVCVATKSRLEGSQVFSPLLNVYKKFIFPNGWGGAGVAVLSKMSLGVQVSRGFLAPEVKLVVLDMTLLSKQSFKLLTVYGGYADQFLSGPRVFSCKVENFSALRRLKHYSRYASGQCWLNRLTRKLWL